MTALVFSVRTGTPAQIIDEVRFTNTLSNSQSESPPKLYGPRMVFIPKMPSLGLLLEYPIFDAYNRKIAFGNEKLQSTEPDYRLPIDFEVHRTEMELFKEQHIYSRMRTIEDKDAL
jgi:tRNA pseudouridine38-40 synthase